MILHCRSILHRFPCIVSGIMTCRGEINLDITFCNSVSGFPGQLLKGVMKGGFIKLF